MKKKYFIKTFGCQMNVYDSHRMAIMLENFGYEETMMQSDADLVIFNTCHIREKAAEKVFSEIPENGIYLFFYTIIGNYATVFIISIKNRSNFIE